MEEASEKSQNTKLKRKDDGLENKIREKLKM